MGVQSTRYICRKEAEDKWIDQQLEADRKRYERQVSRIENEILEEQIEEEFHNYAITTKEHLKEIDKQEERFIKNCKEINKKYERI